MALAIHRLELFGEQWQRLAASLYHKVEQQFAQASVQRLRLNNPKPV